MSRPTFQEAMDDLRRKVHELGWLILEEARIPDLVAWLDMAILRWRLKRNLRRYYRRFKDVRQLQLKSIRKDIR